MTLLELLVQELPKRGGWPQWAAAAVQNNTRYVTFACTGYNIRYDGRLWKSTFLGGTWGENATADNDFIASTIASDHATRIVTREEYEAGGQTYDIRESAVNARRRGTTADRCGYRAE
ncbi:MAG: hypothetical protein ACRCYD_02770 [Plesiomonas sp.]